ncbi:unnamed protein product [Bemisia tabaci]|uniref:Uncharacterized protein n=1 Tax=Bemisia tabaci TaxID=7038 RepID=A0A9P0F3D0_BEMTA|nr:unnamed protein product [Bemisia tabaci]
MGSKLLFSCVCLVVINSVLSAAARAHPYSAEEYCKDLEPQKSMDLDQMMGLWYAVEVVEHRPNVPRSGQGTTVIDSCPVLHLAQTSKHTVRLLWSEKAGQIDYRFSIPDFEAPGRWISTGSQNGSMVTETNYQQFAGTVQVLKASTTQAILTFCSPKSQKFSVVLAREHHVPRAQLRGLNLFIQRKNLTLQEIKEACRNSGSSVIPGYTAFAVILVALFMVLIWRVCSD